MKRILVLGMHRSGASAVARAIGLLGAYTGDQAHLRDTGENSTLRKINDTLLESGGGTWDAPPAGDDWLDSSAAQGLIEGAKQALTTELGDAPVAVWKDPRTSLTLPFWVELFDEEPVVVLVHRHPAEVVASLRLSSSTKPAHGYALWERYNAAALSATVGLRTIVLDYGQVMAFPDAAATFVSQALGEWDVHLPNDPATTDVELSPQRRHHVAPDRDRIDSPSSTASQAELFAFLDDVAGRHSPFALPRPVPEASAVSDELLALVATVRQLERERQEARHNERQAKRAAKRAGAASAAAATTASAAIETTATAGAAETEPEDEATDTDTSVVAPAATTTVVTGVSDGRSKKRERRRHRRALAASATTSSAGSLPDGSDAAAADDVDPDAPDDGAPVGPVDLEEPLASADRR